MGKGGKRAGAGRKESPIKKKTTSFRVREDKIKEFRELVNPILSEINSSLSKFNDPGL